MVGWVILMDFLAIFYGHTCVELVCWRWLARLSCAQLCCTAARLEFRRPGRGPVLSNKGLASTAGQHHYCTVYTSVRKKETSDSPN